MWPKETKKYIEIIIIDGKIHDKHLGDLVPLETNMDGVNCLQGHVTFDQNGNRETLVQITQNKREWLSK